MSIVVVSDVHLGMEEAKEKELIDFITELKDRNVEHLVLLGDILDLWRKDFTNSMLRYSNSLMKINEILDGTEIHYIAGNHDYYLLRLKDKLKKNFPFEVDKTYVIKSKEQEFFFFHGYQLEVLCNPYYKSMETYETLSKYLCLAGDDMGNAAEAIWKLYNAFDSFIRKLKLVPENLEEALNSMMKIPETRLEGTHHVSKPMVKLAKSNTRHFLLSIHPNQYLIYGHTHEAYVDNDNKAANAGSWGFGKENKLEYIEITDDKVELKVFNPQT